MFNIDGEFVSLMNGILYRHIKSKSSHNEIASSAFDYSRWPDCTASAAILFFVNALPKGYDYAKAVTIEAYREYLLSINDRALPKSIELIGEKITQHLKLYWQQKFAMEVSLNPERLDALIQEYQTNKPSGVRLYSLNDELPKMMNRHMQRIQSGESMVVIPGFPDLSDYIGGFNDSRVTLINAKTGFGKTNLAVSLGQAASNIMRVLYFNMEMTPDEFSARFVLNGAGIDNKSWMKGTFLGSNAEKRIIDFTSDRQKKKDIVFTDGKALTMAEIRTSIFSMFDGVEPGLVIVDYDQKIVLKDTKDEWRGLLEAIAELEEIAKRSKTHIILLSQANEDGRSRASIRMEQSATSVLYFTKIPNPFDPIADRYILKGFKTRYSSDKVVELDVDMAKSRVTEKGYMEMPKAASKKGSHAV